MEQYFTQGGTTITFRSNAWDERLWGKPCVELISVSGEGYVETSAAFREFDRQQRQQGVAFCYTRIAADNQNLRKILSENGFYFAEASYNVSKSGLADAMDHRRFLRNDLHLQPYEPKHIDAITAMLASEFEFGRYAEDPWIPRAMSANRFVNWFGDLMLQQTPIYVYLRNSDFWGFHIQNRLNCAVDWLLTGTQKKRAMFSLSLWAAAIELNRSHSVTRISTVISASNVAVVNLYRTLNFSFDTLTLGFHKRYE